MSLCVLFAYLVVDSLVEPAELAHLFLSGIVYLLTFVTVIACSLLDAG